MAVLEFTVGFFLPPHGLKGILRIKVFAYSLDRSLLYRVACLYSLGETASVPSQALSVKEDLERNNDAFQFLLYTCDSGVPKYRL